jgi:hypothetical protein
MRGMKSFLRYRAGSRAVRVLGRDGLRPEAIRAVVGTASGPRWLALAGLDRALMESGFAAAAPGTGRRLLVGASAGAWRALAFASDRPAARHAMLVRAYIGQVFPRNVRPRAVASAYRGMLAEVFPDAAVAAVLAHPTSDVAVHVVRWRGPWPWRSRALQATAMVTASALRRLGVRATRRLVERVLVHARPESLDVPFDGRVVAMTEANVRPAALASGAVPVYVEPVDDVPGAPRGRYADGGLADYHLRQSWAGDGGGLVLLPHFQERVEGEWLDRYANRPPVAAEELADVVQVYPSRDFLAALPGGRLPDREDFFRFVDAPQERIRRWTEAAAVSERLGDEFLRDLASGDLVGRVRAIEN